MLFPFQASGEGLEHPSFSAQKIREFIRGRPDGVNIHIEDMLGEGPGHFDPEPRYLPAEMNCTTWLQSAIVAGYARNEDEKTTIMDKIRYFYGLPGYSTRVHFTDSWVYLNPGPLKPHQFPACGTVDKKTVKVDYNFFKKNKNYTCPLYEEKKDTFDIDYYKPADFLECAKSLKPNVYVIFPVATERYIKIFGKPSGPMGLVHGLILDVTPDEGAPQKVIHHASITRRAVISKNLETYITSPATKNFLGYTLWELDPNWDYKAASGAPPDEINKINELLECEKNL